MSDPRTSDPVAPMTRARLRHLLSTHVRQPGYKRNPGHTVVAIYLGREDFMSLLDERCTGGYSGLSPRTESRGMTFDGVLLHMVDESHHVRIVSEYVDRE